MKSRTIKSVDELVYLIVAAALLSGCTLAPTYERPIQPVPATYPDMTWQSGTLPGKQITDLKWQEFFLDAKLRQVIQLALNNNRDLRVAVINIDRARALYRVQSADRLPTVGVSVGGNRQRTPADLSSQGVSVVSSAYSAGIGITSFELDFFGRVSNLSQAALERYLATEEARRSLHIALIAEAAMRYQALAADQRLLMLASKTLESRSDSHFRQKNLFELGATSEYDLRQSESLLEAARVALAQQVRQRAIDLNALTLLVGTTIDVGLLPETEASTEPKVLAEVSAGLPSDLLTSRPDIRQREAILRSESANIGVARAAFFPRITLTGNWGTSSAELSGLFDTGSRAWNFLPQLSVPIFDAGRNRAGLAVATANRDIAVAEYEQTIQIAFREVADALAGLETYQTELRASRTQEQAEQTRYALAQQRYESGYSSYLEFLDAQRELFAVQQRTIRVELAAQQNQIALYKALGGGWSSLN